MQGAQIEVWWFKLSGIFSSSVPVALAQKFRQQSRLLTLPKVLGSFASKGCKAGDPSLQVEEQLFSPPYFICMYRVDSGDLPWMCAGTVNATTVALCRNWHHISLPYKSRQYVREVGISYTGHVLSLHALLPISIMQWEIVWSGWFQFYRTTANTGWAAGLITVMLDKYWGCNWFHRYELLGTDQGFQYPWHALDTSE